MNKVILAATATAVVAVLGFQQMEIAEIHNEVQEVRSFLEQGSDTVAYTSADENCLAKNIFYEAGVEDVNGKFAVAQVTLNRLKTGKWGKNLCKVVYAPAQFSWTKDARLRKLRPSGILWEESRQVAHTVLKANIRVPSLDKAQFYHTNYIKAPRWAKSLKPIEQVGQHIFYPSISS